MEAVRKEVDVGRVSDCRVLNFFSFLSLFSVHYRDACDQLPRECVECFSGVIQGSGGNRCSGSQAFIDRCLPP